MKHAENLFLEAVNQLIELGEKARKEREARERKASDREAVRVKRKEKPRNKRFYNSTNNKGEMTS